MVDAPEQAGRREHLQDPHSASAPVEESSGAPVKRFATSLFVLAGVVTALLAMLIAGLLINR
jgi:hypothetical protein